MPTPKPDPTQRNIADLQILISQSVDWLLSHFIQIAIATGIASAIVLVLLAIRSYGMRLCRHERHHAGWGQTIGRVIARTRLWFLIPLAAKIVDGMATPPPSLMHLIDFLFTVTSAFQAALWAREFVLGIVEHRAGDNPDHRTLGSAMGLIRVLVTFALFAIASVLILDNLGVNVTGLVAGLGIGGIAIGLAAQGIFSDLFAALAIIFDRPFRIGDTISFGNSTGSVEFIGLKTVRVRSVDGEEIIISNAKLLSDQVRNMTNIFRRRVLQTLQLVYTNDPAKLASLPNEIKAIVSAEPLCTFTHAWLNGFGTNAITLELLFTVDSPDGEKFNQARHDVMIKILKRMDELGVVFSYPVQPLPDA
jgi:small-conductance mechanosensitive channel